MTLYEYLRTQFTDLESAKVFINKWCKEDQKLPDEFGTEIFKQRSMCAHISNVLENIDADDEIFTNYMKSKHGPDLYWSIGDPKYMK